VDVAGGQWLKLVVTDGGDGITCDVAHWADARLVLDPAKPVPQPGAERPTLDIAPFAQVITADGLRMDGVHNGRFDSFPQYELKPEWEFSPDKNGGWTPPVLSGRATIGLRWLERRRVRRLALRFAEPATVPAASNVVVQQWVMTQSGISAGGSRWQGHWQPMPGSVRAAADGGLLFTVDDGTRFQTRTEDALKVRWVLPAGAESVRIAGLSAWTDTPWTTSELELRADPPRAGIATVALYNGEIVGGTNGAVCSLQWNLARPLSLVVRHSRERPWKSDRTALRLTLPDVAFTIAVDDVLAQNCVWVKDFGVWAAKTPADTSIEAYRKKFQGARTVLDRVRSMPEQTLQSAWKAVHRPAADLGPTLLSLACDNHKYLVERSGQIQFESASAAVYHSVDHYTGGNYSCRLQPEFGTGGALETTRHLEGGWLPLPVIEMKQEGMTYRMRVYVAPYGRRHVPALGLALLPRITIRGRLVQSGRLCQSATLLRPHRRNLRPTG
jgi:hypothetical protein